MPTDAPNDLMVDTRDRVTSAPCVIKPRMMSSFITRTASDVKGCKPTGVVVTGQDDIVLVDDINKKIKVGYNIPGVLCDHSLI